MVSYLNNFPRLPGHFFWKQNRGDEFGCMDGRNLHLSPQIAKYHRLIFLFHPGTRKMENPLEKKGKLQQLHLYFVTVLDP